MKSSQKLIGVGCGLTLASLNLSYGWDSNNPSHSKNADPNTFLVQATERTSSYKSIDKVLIYDFLEDYLKKVTPVSDNFQKLNKIHGKMGLLERYCSAHEICLDLAFKYPKDISLDKFNELGEKLAKMQDKLSRDKNNKKISPVDYLDDKVESRFGKWGRLKTLHFQRLLNTGKKLENKKFLESDMHYLIRIHRSAYTNEEYAEYIKQQNIANDNLYDSMKDTLGFLEKLLGGKQIDRIKKITNKVYSDTIKDFYETGRDKNGKH